MPNIWVLNKFWSRPWRLSFWTGALNGFLALHQVHDEVKKYCDDVVPLTLSGVISHEALCPWLCNISVVVLVVAVDNFENGLCCSLNRFA